MVGIAPTKRSNVFARKTEGDSRKGDGKINSSEHFFKTKKTSEKLTFPDAKSATKVAS